MRRCKNVNEAGSECHGRFLWQSIFAAYTNMWKNNLKYLHIKHETTKSLKWCPLSSVNVKFIICFQCISSILYSISFKKNCYTYIYSYYLRAVCVFIINCKLHVWFVKLKYFPEIITGASGVSTCLFRRLVKVTQCDSSKNKTRLTICNMCATLAILTQYLINEKYIMK